MVATLVVLRGEGNTRRRGQAPFSVRGLSQKEDLLKVSGVWSCLCRCNQKFESEGANEQGEPGAVGHFAPAPSGWALNPLPWGFQKALWPAEKAPSTSTRGIFKFRDPGGGMGPG